MRLPVSSLVCTGLVAVLPLVACNKPAEEPLPPPGLAGAASPTTIPPSTALPGAGSQVAPTSGAAALPAGHPPIGGVPAGTPTGTQPAGLPMDHSNRPDPPMGSVALPGSGSVNAAPPSATVTLSGTVQETLNVPEYTYMRVKVASGGDEWVAVPRTQIAVGDKVTVNQSIVMNNFPSKALNRTFDKLTMGMLVGAPQKAN